MKNKKHDLIITAIVQLLFGLILIFLFSAIGVLIYGLYTANSILVFISTYSTVLLYQGLRDVIDMLRELDLSIRITKRK